MHYALRSTTHRYIRYTDGKEELYDHRRDPNEWKNIASNPENKPLIEYFRDELKTFVPELMGATPSKWIEKLDKNKASQSLNATALASKWFEKMDKNKDGKVSESEWMERNKASQEKRGKTFNEEKARETFRGKDQNKDGVLSPAELDGNTSTLGRHADVN
jgi:hypothetical protein